MVIELKTVVEDDKTHVLYVKDGIETAKIQTTDPIATISGLLNRVEADPHMIFAISARIDMAENNFHTIKYS